MGKRTDDAADEVTVKRPHWLTELQEDPLGKMMDVGIGLFNGEFFDVPQAREARAEVTKGKAAQNTADDATGDEENGRDANQTPTRRSQDTTVTIRHLFTRANPKRKPKADGEGAPGTSTTEAEGAKD